MKYVVFAAALLAVAFVISPAHGEDATMPANPVIAIKTSMGTMTAELWPEKAPKTVENFLSYVDESYFDGLVFHRVIPNFMVQGGGFDTNMVQKKTKAPVVNEASADVPNKRGTLAMARTTDINSATSQFFINLADNGFLNHRDKSVRGYGYCVFGKLTDGLDVLDKIAAVKTGKSGPHSDVPVEAVTITSIKRSTQ